MAFTLSNLEENSHIHFIGIGGISMSGLAIIMCENGYTVTGSDREETRIIKKLVDMGAKVFYGHREENVHEADVVVYTAAIKEDNPEIMYAKENNIPLVTRAEFLGAIMKTYRHACGISGTHGKTTTTSMLSYALLHAGMDPTISVGGELDIINGNIKTGKSDYFITEACEYTNSFLSFFPTIAVITNIDEDHLDFFSGIEEIRESFRNFAMLTKDKGCVVASGMDENVKLALSGTGLDIKYYGIGDDSEYHAENIKYTNGFASFQVWHYHDLLCQITLKVPGEHNVLNALATIAVCHIWGADITLAKKGIEAFHGAGRRFEEKGYFKGAKIMDDYAHHPTEIKATLGSAKKMEKNRLWCIFQPHTYSRTRTLWNEFCESFDDCDELIITKIYAARELPDGVTTAENLANDIKKRGLNVRYIDELEQIEVLLKNELAEGDLVFTMGAGNIYTVGENIIE
ncbi:MAG: UDP-N-acetylmuramate--L-alanine ligase [Ruminococcaceae bacterium]|nr:UDP-N-acetylmuramate--L-alanine ligase [Oscillospiraceae bacterium]